MIKDLNPITFGVLGFVLGLIVYGYFLRPDIETKVVESIKIETKIDSVAHKEVSRLSNYIDSLKSELGKKPPIEHEFIRDTLLVDWKPQINSFRAVFPHTYGNAYLSGEVLGEVLNTELTTDFKLPTITNTITKEKNTTIIKKPSGIYLTGGISNQFSASIGGLYLRDKSVIGYSYQPSVRVHSVSVGWKVF